MRFFLCSLLALLLIPTASALNQQDVDRLITDPGWTYDEFWIYYEVLGADAFALEAALVVPIATAADNQTARAWIVYWNVAAWSSRIEDCTIVYPPAPIESATCALGEVLSPPTDPSPLGEIVTRAPGELQSGADASIGGGSSRAIVAAGHLSEFAVRVADRWTTDILALVD